jgi:hypothetical protein
MTHTRQFDVVVDLYKKLLILLGIFASYEHMERDLAASQGFQMLCCRVSVSKIANKASAGGSVPFFAVVTM